MNKIFSKNQLGAFSEIFRDIAQVCFAAFLIEPILNKTTSATFFTLGILFSISFWVLSIIIIKTRT